MTPVGPYMTPLGPDTTPLGPDMIPLGPAAGGGAGRQGWRQGGRFQPE